jgi:hypothetical protein
MWNLLGSILVLVGDLLAAITLLVSVGALLATLRGWQSVWVRQFWSNGLAGLLIGALALLGKLLGDEPQALNGAAGWSNPTIAVMLAVAGMMLLAAWLWKRRPAR